MSNYDKLLLDKAKEFYLKKIKLLESLDKHLTKKGNLSKGQQNLLRNLINDNTYSKK